MRVDLHSRPPIAAVCLGGAVLLSKAIEVLCQWLRSGVACATIDRAALDACTQDVAVLSIRASRPTDGFGP